MFAMVAHLENIYIMHAPRKCRTSSRFSHLHIPRYYTVHGVQVICNDNDLMIVLTSKVTVKSGSLIMYVIKWQLIQAAIV
jgi:hypothetical protein